MRAANAADTRRAGVERTGSRSRHTLSRSTERTVRIVEHRSGYADAEVIQRAETAVALRHGRHIEHGRWIGRLVLVRIVGGECDVHRVRRLPERLAANHL